MLVAGVVTMQRIPEVRQLRKGGFRQLQETPAVQYRLSVRNHRFAFWYFQGPLQLQLSLPGLIQTVLVFELCLFKLLREDHRHAVPLRFDDIGPLLRWISGVFHVFFLFLQRQHGFAFFAPFSASITRLCALAVSGMAQFDLGRCSRTVVLWKCGLQFWTSSVSDSLAFLPTSSDPEVGVKRRGANGLSRNLLIVAEVVRVRSTAENPDKFSKEYERASF